MQLRKSRNILRAELKNNYKSKVQPFIDIIRMTMNANDENEFEAIKRIKAQFCSLQQPC